MVAGTVAFRSKPITSRYQPQSRTQAGWQPTGSFPFFLLPAELRDEIFSILIHDSRRTFRDVLHLFLACRRMYADGAAMFYRKVELNLTRTAGRAKPLLAGPPVELSPRRSVESLSIRFYLKDHIQLFQEDYAAAISDMVEHGSLKELRLEIASRFPSSDFWGGLVQPATSWTIDEDARLIVGQPSDRRDLIGPPWVTEPSFQAFLRFLFQVKVPHRRLFVESYDHPRFWCPFHRKHKSGQRCNGVWMGKARFLKVDWRGVHAAFKEAQLAAPM